MKKRTSLIVVAAIVGVLVFACGGCKNPSLLSPSPTPTPGPVAASEVMATSEPAPSATPEPAAMVEPADTPEPGPASAPPVELSLAAEIEDDRLTIRGTASVPDGALIVYEVTHEAPFSEACQASNYGCSREGHAAVQDGAWQSEVALGGWPAGELWVWASFQTDLANAVRQPDEIIALYGELGERITGPHTRISGAQTRAEVILTVRYGPVGPAGLPALGEAVSIEGHRMSLDRAEVAAGLLVADFTVDNVGDEQIIVSSLLSFSARDSEGARLDVALFDCPGGQLDGTVLPKEMLRGSICWRVPEPGPYRIYYHPGFYGGPIVVWHVGG